MQKQHNCFPILQFFFQTEIVSKKLQEKGRITGVFVPNSDNYLKFLVQELKPYIDNKYSVANLQECSS